MLVPSPQWIHLNIVLYKRNLATRCMYVGLRKTQWPIFLPTVFGLTVPWKLDGERSREAAAEARIVGEGERAALGRLVQIEPSSNEISFGRTCPYACAKEGWPFLHKWILKRVFLVVQVRNVVIHSCPDLLLSLDLQGVDPTTVPFTIRYGRVLIHSVVRR